MTPVYYVLLWMQLHQDSLAAVCFAIGAIYLWRALKDSSSLVLLISAVAQVPAAVPMLWEPAIGTRSDLFADLFYAGVVGHYVFMLSLIWVAARIHHRWPQLGRIPTQRTDD